MSLSVSFRFFVVVNNVQWGSCSLGLRASRYISQGSVSSGRVWTSPGWEQLGDIRQRLFPFTPHIRSESSQASHPRPHLLWWDIILWSGQWVWRDTSLLTESPFPCHWWDWYVFPYIYWSLAFSLLLNTYLYPLSLF